jgi:hypothetical protein
MFIPDQYKRQQSSMHDNNSRKKGHKSEIYEQIFIGLGLQVFCTICHLLSPVLCFVPTSLTGLYIQGGGGRSHCKQLSIHVFPKSIQPSLISNYQLNICNKNYEIKKYDIL